MRDLINCTRSVETPVIQLSVESRRCVGGKCYLQCFKKLRIH